MPRPGVLAEKRSATHVLVVSDGSEGAAALPAVLGSTLDRAHSASGESDIWTDFLSRPADYFGMLTELGFLTEDEKKMHGDLPEEVIEAVRAIELKKGLSQGLAPRLPGLRCSLRPRAEEGRHR